MAESTLTIDFAEMKARLGHWLGVGRSGTVFDSYEAQLGRLVNDGARRFYGEYDWSFLKPERTLAIVADTTIYAAPDDLGGVEGPMTFTTTTARPCVVPQLQLQALRYEVQRQPALTGPPRFFAIDQVELEAVTGQRYTFVIFPTPDQSYTLNYVLHVHPNAMSTATDKAYGGMQHSDTIMAAARLEAAHQVAENMIGEADKAYREALTRSVQYDSNKLRAETFGVANDPAMSGFYFGHERLSPDIGLQYTPS